MSEQPRHFLEMPRFSWYRPMRGRTDTAEARAATPLELLFDLCFVVAVAQAGGRLEDHVLEGEWGAGVLGFTVVFFAIWWAWMNFTWFASAYDTDDVPYRFATLVQIAGVLILAAGVPEAFDDFNLTVPILGYALSGDRLDPLLARLKEWMERNHAGLVAGILVVIGLLVLYKGVHGL